MTAATARAEAPSAILAAAREYVARGWSVVPLGRAAKAPTLRGWQRLRLQGADLEREVGSAGGIGILCGAPSGGLCDVDFDDAYARAAWPLLGPATDMRHGRASSPESHAWYVVDAPPAQTERLRDPTARDAQGRAVTLIELRSSGGQTVVPPSTHPTGEAITWHAAGEPAHVAVAALQRAVRQCAAVAMLARRWPDGARHDVALALAGTLLRGGMAAQDAEQIIGVLARVAGDPEVADRVRAVRDTAAAIAAGDPATGGPRLAELLADGEAVVARLREWLGLRQGEDAATPGLRVVTVAELLTLDLAPREMVLAPVLPTQGLAMLYGPRGAGKTYFTLSIALAIATGAALLRWSAPQPRRVLYVDGEMPAVTMRDRLRQLIRGARIAPEPDMLRIITPDLQPGPLPDLARPEGQRAIAPHLDGVDTIIVDSISTLTSAAESEADEWLPLQRWVLAQRRAGRTVLLIHHAGKGGQQRGTSRREDVLDTVLALRRPRDYRAEQGARVELALEKGRGVHGDDARTIEVSLADDGRGGLVWASRSLDDCLTERVAAMIRDGMTHRQIATELSVGVATVARHRRLAQAAGHLPGGDDD
ncbi:AAA family ATPase [bacterium]|nr:AAA family ATPase [bacterium]